MHKRHKVHKVSATLRQTSNNSSRLMPALSSEKQVIKLRGQVGADNICKIAHLFDVSNQYV
jgi:hypothetical protein